jgi:hypothetical protein
MRTLLAAIVLLLVAVSPIALADNLTLASDGKSDYQIIIPAGASPSEKRGAAELQTHIERICGVKLPIATDAAPLPAHAILVGNTQPTTGLLKNAKPAALGDEGFLLRTAGPHLIVYGSDVRGAMYGCSTLLERLGVRWYTPKVTFIPFTRTLTLAALDETHLPAFEYREAYIAEAQEKDWAARLRLNGQHHPLDASTGGKVRYSHFVHTSDELIPRELFATHPEYFPLIKGKRTNGYVQRCLTNPDVLKLATQTALDWIAKDPDALIYSVSQNDTANWCECDECKKVTAQYGAHSGLYLWFVNQVAAEVEKKHPDKLIDTLAYQFTETPPTGIVPRKNVRVRLCPIAACTAHPYESCAAPPTVAFLKNLRGWAGITDTLYIWHYNTDFGHYMMPFPDFSEFPADVRLYKKSGVNGIFFEGAYGPGGGGSFGELQAYVMAKLMWDPELDEKAIIKQWHQGVYGFAAPPMLEWFDLLHAKAADPKAHFFCYTNPIKAPYLTPDVIAAGDALFDQARTLAASNPLAAEYVDKARLGLRYVKLIQHPTTGDDFTSFVADLHKFQIGHIREGMPIDAWEREYRAKHK